MTESLAAATGLRHSTAMRILGTLLIGLVIVVAVLAGGVWFALGNLDLSRYQGLASDRVQAATGRTLALDGALRVAPGLRPTLVAEGVRFSNAPGAAEPDMVRVARVEAQVQLLPLLRGEVRIDRLVLAGLRVILDADASGGGNWNLQPPGGAGAPAPGAAPGSPLAPLALLGAVALGIVIWARRATKREER